MDKVSFLFIVLRNVILCFIDISIVQSGDSVSLKTLFYKLARTV